MGLDDNLWTTLKAEINKIKEKAKSSGEILMLASGDAKGMFTESLKEKTVNVSFDDFDIDLKDESANNIQKALNWLGGMVSKLRARTEENREFLQRVFGLLKDFATQLDEVRVKTINNQDDIYSENAKQLEMIDDMKEEMAGLQNNLDEARQRGLKGNIIVSSPTLPARNNQPEKPALLKQPTGGDPTSLESDLDFVLRLVETKTGVRVPREDVGACHALRAKANAQPSYILTFQNRKENSAWDQVTSCMMSGSAPGGGSMNMEINVFLNFQLTHARAELARAVRKARAEKKVQRERVNANGEIRATIAGNKYTVTSLAHLEELTRNVVPEAMPNRRTSNRPPAPRTPWPSHNNSQTRR